MRSTRDMETAREEFEPGVVRGSSLTRQEQSHRTACIEAARKHWHGLLPLSFAQERLWFLDQLGLVGAAYNMPMAVTIDGNLDVAALERCFCELVRRHESLRTRFEAQAGVPHQSIDPPHPCVVHRADLRELSAERRAARLTELSLAEQLQRFDLRRGPLFRVLLITLDPRQYLLLFTIHHIVCDGWSLAVLRRELGALYGAYSQGRPSPLPELSFQYADYALWQRGWLQGEALQEQLRYWRERLLELTPQLELPTDRARPAAETFKGARLNFELPRGLSRALQELASREGVTLFMVWLAVYQVLLSRWSGQHDIVVGVPIAGRSISNVEELIGFFVNTLPLRTIVSPELTFRELLRRVRDDVALEAYVHQDVPFEVLVKELRPDRHLTRQPIFQVALVVQNYPDERLELPGLTCATAAAPRLTTHFDLTLFVQGNVHSERLSAVFEYASDLFDEQTIARMQTHLRVLMEEIVDGPDCQIGRLPLLGAAERQQVLAQWNDTRASYPDSMLVHQLFEQQAQRTPRAIAVLHEGRSLTYAQLNARANLLASALRAAGIGPDEPVGICSERCPELIVGVLGILKAGGAYMPLDPSYPTERLQYMLEDAAPSVALVQNKLRAVLPTISGSVMVLEACASGAAESCVSDPPLLPGQAASNLAYVIYTSGSTGRPKGTAMPHRSMVNLLEWHRRELPLATEQRVLQFAALSFDVAFQEIFSTLSAGGTLVLLDERTRRDAGALLHLLGDRRIERLFIPPMMLQSLAECASKATALPHLREIIVAGEQLRISPEVARFCARLDDARLHNHYGPTETHVVTALTLEADPQLWPALPTIGRPISNVQIYVLDGQRQVVPIGVAGEIYIGGAALARGYHKRAELSAQRFLQDPFSADPQARLYRTGDLGRWRSDGTLEYLGRNDEQVKIRGFRVELGEITAQLLANDQVADAAVIAREDSPGDRRLVAYLTKAGANAPSIVQLRAHLQSVLPEYMVPSAFVLMQRLPLSPNGKLDRRALPTPAAGDFVREEYQAPLGELEEAIAATWKKLLHLERVGRRDNFFHLGGHSLLATRVIAHLRETLDVEVPLRVLFEQPTVQGLAEFILERLAADLSATEVQ